MDKKDLIKVLENKYPTLKIFEDGNGWVDHREEIFTVSAEHEAMSSDGYDLFAYYTENYEIWDMGIHNEFNELLSNNGWYAEWVNPGIVAIVKD